jgi:hypothetical protein
MQQDQLLKLLNTIVGNHLIRDAVHILKVVGRLDEGAYVKVRRDGLKGCPGARSRHRRGLLNTIHKPRGGLRPLKFTSAAVAGAQSDSSAQAAQVAVAVAGEDSNSGGVEASLQRCGRATRLKLTLNAQFTGGGGWSFHARASES